MTPVLARKPLRITISGRKFSGAGLAGILERKSYTKQLVPFIAPVPWSWISPTPSRSAIKIVEMTTSEICAAEFADWTIFDADFGNDEFLGECMRLFNVWLWCAEEDAPWDAWYSWKEMDNTPRDTMTALSPAQTAIRITTSERARFAQTAWRTARNDSSTSLSSLCSTWSCTTLEWKPFACRCDEELEEGMRLFAAWSTEAEAEDEDDEEVLVEPESHDMAALVSTKDLLPAPSAGLLRALSCPDRLMESLAVVLFETRHFTVLNPGFGPSVFLNTGFLNAGFLNSGSGLLALPAPALNAGSGLLALPAPPAWMLALEYDRETDAARSVSTVSLPSGWDAVSARLSSSSIFNLFSTSTSSASSLFADPTGFPSLDSTVAPWETPATVASTDSVTGSSFTSSASSDSAYPAGAPSLRTPATNFTSNSSLFADPTEETSSVVSIPPNFFAARAASSSSCTSSASSDCTDIDALTSEHVCHTSCFDGTTSASSEFDDSTEASSASSSSLFPDPRSAHACSASCFEVAPSTASASSIFPDPRSAHSCTSSCFELSSSSTSSASSATSASINSSICSNCGVRHEESDDQSSASSTTSASSDSSSSICSKCGVRHDEQEEESDEESSVASTSSSAQSSNPYRYTRFGTYTLLPSSSDSSDTSSASSGYESDTDLEEEASSSPSDHAYVIIDPIEPEPARRSPSNYCFEEAVVDAVEESPAAVVETTVATVSAATQTAAPDEEVCGLDAYLELFDEVHEMRRKLMETMGGEEEQAPAPQAPALEPEQTYNHEESAIISRMAIAWDALLEDTSRLLKKAFEAKRSKIRFLM